MAPPRSKRRNVFIKLCDESISVKHWTSYILIIDNYYISPRQEFVASFLKYSWRRAWSKIKRLFSPLKTVKRIYRVVCWFAQYNSSCKQGLHATVLGLCSLNSALQYFGRPLKLGFVTRHVDTNTLSHQTVIDIAKIVQILDYSYNNLSVPTRKRSHQTFRMTKPTSQHVDNHLSCEDK